MQGTWLISSCLHSRLQPHITNASMTCPLQGPGKDQQDKKHARRHVPQSGASQYCKMLPKMFILDAISPLVSVLGLQDQFDGILGADFMGDFCKPDPEAFEKVRAAPSACSLCNACLCAAWDTAWCSRAQCPLLSSC